MTTAIPSEENLDRVMARAVAKQRGDGTFHAYIERAAHHAYAFGQDHRAALAELRKEVRRNWGPVVRALQVIEGKEAL